jgi:hypothetical protein
MVPIDQHVTICEEHGGKATGAERIVHCRRLRPVVRQNFTQPTFQLDVTLLHPDAQASCLQSGSARMTFRRTTGKS